MVYEKAGETQRSLLFFVYTLDGGGAERVASELCNLWAADGVRITLVTVAGVSRNDYSLDGRIHRIAMEQDEHGSHPLGTLAGNIRRVLTLRALIREHRPDVVLSFITEANIIAILASRLAGTRVVVSERGYCPMQSIRRIWSLMRRRVYRLADTVVVQTSSVASWITNECRTRSVKVIPNMVRLPLPSGEPVLPPHSIVGDDRKVVLCVSQLREEKGIDRLITAFASVSSGHPDWSVVICGSGPERERLQLLVSNLKLESRIHLAGKVGNVQQWYERSQLFALTSRSEGFPNALLEAMACACAPVSFDCEAGPRDIIRQGVDGILVADQDVEALASALDRMMSDAGFRESLSARATEVTDRFDCKKVLTQWESALW